MLCFSLQVSCLGVVQVFQLYRKPIVSCMSTTYFCLLWNHFHQEMWKKWALDALMGIQDIVFDDCRTMLNSCQDLQRTSRMVLYRGSGLWSITKKSFYSYFLRSYKAIGICHVIPLLLRLWKTHNDNSFQFHRTVLLYCLAFGSNIKCAHSEVWVVKVIYDATYTDLQWRNEEARMRRKEENKEEVIVTSNERICAQVPGDISVLRFPSTVNSNKMV